MQIYEDYKYKNCQRFYKGDILKNRKQIEAINNLKKCDRILKILRNSNIPNKDEQIAFYERKKVKQEQILRNLKRYKKNR